MLSRREQADLAYSAVSRQIHELNQIRGTGEEKALLANLRRAAGKSPAEVPEIWGAVLSGLETEDRGRRSLGADESAVFLTMTLYAVASQGRDSRSQEVQQKGVSLGKAAGLVVRKDPEKMASMQTRLKSVLSSRQYAEIGTKLRTLIPLLIADGGLDFPMLAKDLVLLSDPHTKSQVGIFWAREFVRAMSPEKKAEEDSTQEKE
ncbi:type I-E CRISPR-associated protein Cse2/CasB [Allobaculum mucilyticum]|uniref:type I-E CRISPR-associated protein Cse2/CasB n=1 Tax=Allobaculum mucilyticum TaxID=2834459 RepID=UPI001E3C4870|nr:type I-E CRISPR-associated protein Cse2/CasB [Allobaculum mucilyticum]UNT95278.1 type I-E CRISPR-associated protein Cse2/CasB [Allobaculum mucilyticum]